MLRILILQQNAQYQTEAKDWHQCNFPVQSGTGLYMLYRVNLGCLLWFLSKNGSESGRFWGWEDFEKFLPRFLFSKKMADMIFFNLESSSRCIPDIFYFLWEVFLTDFLSKMEPQKAWNSFGTILNWWNFGLHWIKFCILPCCVLLLIRI